MTEQEIQAHALNVSNWTPLPELAEGYPQFTLSQLKTLFWKRDRKEAKFAGLNRCSRICGKKLYVCRPLFGAWLGGLLPEQREAK